MEPVTHTDLLTLIGAKEVELTSARGRERAARAEAEKLRAELKTARDAVSALDAEVARLKTEAPGG